MMCMKYAQKHFWTKHLCVPSFLACAHLTTCVHAHTRYSEGTLLGRPCLAAVVFPATLYWLFSLRLCVNMSGCLGLSCRDLLHQFQHKLLILFKLMLLEKRVRVTHRYMRPICAKPLLTSNF